MLDQRIRQLDAEISAVESIVKRNTPFDDQIRFLRDFQKDIAMQIDVLMAGHADPSSMLPLLRMHRQEVNAQREGLEHIGQHIFVYRRLSDFQNLTFVGIPKYIKCVKEECTPLLPKVNSVELIRYMARSFKHSSFISFDNEDPGGNMVEDFLVSNSSVRLPSERLHRFPIQDFTAPTIGQLIPFWKLVDELAEQPDTGILLHCWGSTGRTPVMIMSYLWMRLFQKDRVKYPLLPPAEIALLRTLKNSARVKSIEELMQPHRADLACTSAIVDLLAAELPRYSPKAYEEVFSTKDNNECSYRLKLFVDRLVNISDAIAKYAKNKEKNVSRELRKAAAKAQASLIKKE